MDFFRKKKSEGKDKKQHKHNKKGRPSKEDDIKLTVTDKQTSRDLSQMPSHVETDFLGTTSHKQGKKSPKLSQQKPVEELKPAAASNQVDVESEVVLNADCGKAVATPNGVEAYKQFEEILHKMDRALESDMTEDSELDDDGEKIQRLQNTDGHNVKTTQEPVPSIQINQPSSDESVPISSESFTEKAVLDWSGDDVVQWCLHKGFKDFAELFEGCTVDGETLIEMTFEDLVELDIGDEDIREKFLAEVNQLRSTLIEDRHTIEQVHPVSLWTNDDVLLWLEEVGLDKFLTVFRDYDVTGEQLLDLDLQMLNDLGIKSVDDREEFCAKFYELLDGKTVAETCLERMREANVKESKEQCVDMEASTDDDNSERIDEETVESKRRIEQIWGLIESKSSLAGSSSTDNISEKGLPAGKGTCTETERVKTLNQIQAEIDEMESNITKLESELQGTKASTYEHTSIQLKLSNAQTMLRSLHQQKALLLDDASDELRSEEGTFEIRTSDLYFLLNEKPHSVITVDVPLVEDEEGQARFSVADDEEHGGLIVVSCQEGVPFKPGDRLLEVNGYNISSSPSSVFNQFLATRPAPLSVVVIRQKQKGSDHADDDDAAELKDLKDDLSLVLKDLEATKSETKKIKEENVQLNACIKSLQDDKSQLLLKIASLQKQTSQSEARWKDLKKLLERMKNEPCDIENVFGNVLQKKKLTADHANHDEAYFQQTISVLQRTLEEKHEALVKIETEKNEYRKRLYNLINDNTSHDVDVPYENLDDSLPLWESLKTCSKAEVLQALKDNILENERQKIFLDQLLAVVIKRAPSLLQKVDEEVKFEAVKNGPEFFS